MLHQAAHGILAPRPGIKPGPSAVKVQNPNHWTAKEFPKRDFKKEKRGRKEQVRQIGNNHEINLNPNIQKLC